MSEPAIIALASFVSVAALVLLIANLRQQRPGAVQRRLQDHAVTVIVTEAQRQERIKVLKERGMEDALSGASRLSRLRIVRTAARELSRAGWSTSVRRYLVLRFAVGVLFVIVAQIATGNAVIALLFALVGFMALRFVVRQRGKRRLAAFEAQLAESIDLFVGALRAGHGFLQGMESVANQMEDPTKSELARVLEEVNVGINPVEALTAVTTRIPSYDLKLFVSAIAVQRQTGGNLAEVMENLAATIRERRRIRGEVKALTTGPRVSSYVLFAIPVGLFFYFLMISSEYRTTMLHTTYGHLLLGLVAILNTLGFITTRKVAKVEY